MASQEMASVPITTKNRHKHLVGRVRGLPPADTRGTRLTSTSQGVLTHQSPQESVQLIDFKHLLFFVCVTISNKILQGS